jgi:hypothetical protein
MRRRDIHSEIQGCSESQLSLSPFFNYVVDDIGATMSGSGLCRAMWEFIGIRFRSQASDKYESNDHTT